MMWKYLKNSSPPLYLTFNEKSNGYEVLVTDYTSLWREHFTKEEFYLRIKKCNKDLELETDDGFIQQGIAVLTQPDEIKKSQVKKQDDDKLSICMYQSFGYLFIVECEVTKLSEQFFFHHVTKPLLETITELRSSETVLRETVKNKDSVIKAYKKMGVSLTGRRVKLHAVEFNVDAHIKKYKKYETIFGINPDSILANSELPSDYQNGVMESNLKIEPGSVKTEPETENYAVHSPVFLNIKQENIKTERKRLNI